MKKIIIISGLFISCLGAFAQGSSQHQIKVNAPALAERKDSIQYVPVYVFEKTDTIKVNLLTYKGENKTVKYAEPGYVIVKGQATYTEKDKWQYLPGSQESPNPVVIGGLDEKKKPVQPIM